MTKKEMLGVMRKAGECHGRFIAETFVKACAEAEKSIPPHRCKFKKVKNWGKQVTLSKNPTYEEVMRAGFQVENATKEICTICGKRKGAPSLH